MARKYSQEELAAVWALHSQGRPPIDIRRALAAEDSPLGYPLEVPRRSMQDILRRLERQLGPPVAAIKPGEEDDAIDAIRREGLGAIRRRVAELTAKQDLGEELTAAEVRTLNAAVLAADGAARRARDIDKPPAIGKGKGPAATSSSSSALLGAMGRALSDQPVADDAVIKETDSGDSEAGDDAEDSEPGEITPDIDGDSLDPAREHATA